MTRFKVTSTIYDGRVRSDKRPRPTSNADAARIFLAGMLAVPSVVPGDLFLINSVRRPTMSISRQQSKYYR